MARSSLSHQPEVFLSHSAISRPVSGAVRKGRARKLAPRLYTLNTADAPEAVIRRNRWQVVRLLHPGTVVSHRTALSGRPAPDGTVFITGDYNRLRRLPGLTISMRKGPGALDGDRPFLGDLWIASEPRALLEVLAPSRSKGTVSRGLSQAEVEERLDRKLRAGGRDSLNRIRDRARALAPALNAGKELERLDALIGTLLGTRAAELSHPAALSRAAGEPYDPGRLELLQTLFETLRDGEWTRRPDRLEDPDFRHLAFFDAYFSNFIEGTVFELEEARRIVFEGHIPEDRPKDSHDVLGTWNILSRRDLMGLGSQSISGGQGFLEVLRERHRAMLGMREEARPGRFKTETNRAGSTVFVEPDLVQGTLLRGFELAGALADALERGIFLSVLVSEVHLFRDGNGRLARLMMNAELVSGGLRRILVPPGFREDYLLALRAFSRQGRVGPVIQMFDRAQALTAEVDFADLDDSEALLRRCGAFGDPERAVLRLPSELGLATRDAKTGRRAETWRRGETA